jgi:CobQ-like glutamine amidotransferase family enzyme
MSKKPITILQLYPSEMNVYGDFGNTLCLKKRLEWRGIAVNLIEHHPNKPFPKNVDIIVGGGGQDSGQIKIQDDLVKIGPILHQLADQDVPMLMICGLYQLFGRFFRTKDGTVIPGIGIFGAETHAGDTRLIGNIVTKNKQFGEIIGYENHSGLTYLDANQKALGEVIKGVGNNTRDHHEGAIYRNVIGTYLHGSLLPKNPNIADFLIAGALREDITIENDALEKITDHARSSAKKRPR